MARRTSRNRKAGRTRGGPRKRTLSPADGIARAFAGIRGRFGAYALLHPRRVRLTCVAVAAFVLLGLVGLDRATSISCGSAADCVSVQELREGAPLPEALRLYDRYGGLLAEVAGPLRHTLAHDEIPALVADAFVAVEDRRFWEHDGVDGRGVLRAAFRNVRGGGISEGASTIPMQLVRTIWAERLRDVGPWRRKVIEARTAPRLIEELGRERVLALYLNAIYLGNGLYGIERASQYYFGAGVADLDVGQIATLVGITRSPESYEPRRHPDRARSVRGVVLGLLAEADVITQEEAAAAEERELLLAPLDPAWDGLNQRSYVTAAVTREVRRLAPDLAGTPGLGVHTTLDPFVQSLGEAELVAQLARIEAGDPGSFAMRDSASRLEGAALALDAHTGEVLAWIGGRDFETSEFDRVEQARRQVGSLVKPLLVASALERGFGILDVVSADTIPIPTVEGGWLPADHVSETSLPLRDALVRSSNRAAARLGVDLGLETLTQIGTRVGIAREIPRLPSSSIGAFDASLLEMTAAYAIFGNGGHAVEPYLIEWIEAPDGSELWRRPEPVKATRVLTEAQAFVVLDAMRAVVNRGTGVAVRGNGYRGAAAGKTGTTNESRDAWFVGLTPEMVAGIWVGFDQPAEIVSGGGGGTLAAPAWGRWMEEVRRSGRPRSRAWIPPGGVERIRYDALTGEVYSLACRDRSVSAGYHEAWVEVGRYPRGSCSGWRRGFLGRLWRAAVPRN